jgi:hypothetical protein
MLSMMVSELRTHCKYHLSGNTSVQPTGRQKLE